MKKLIKLGFVVLALAIFSFSDNTTITKVRKTAIAKATQLIEKGNDYYDAKEKEILVNME